MGRARRRADRVRVGKTPAVVTFAQLRRYWDTVRYLRVTQITGRLRFRFFRPRLSSAPTPAPRLRTGVWVTPITRAPSMMGPDTFRFLNSVDDVPTAADWNDTRRPKLWTYNLHYFDDLSARDVTTRAAWHVRLLTRWIAENPPVAGCGWDPYPTSLRIVNWIRWCVGGGEPPAGFARSLALQARWLAQRVEFHIEANHLFVNAKALVMAGTWFAGDEADRWRALGLRILATEVPRQVLADGAHYERSPMYHALILEDMLDLLNASAAWPQCIPETMRATLAASASRMLGWLSSMTHRDGGIAFFNDAAFGIAPALAELVAYADRLGVAIGATFPRAADSGYVRAEAGDAVVLIDVAPIGPDAQPGHAHADTLSFEMSLGQQRVLVNSGTSTYDIGPLRAFERSTAAHNTVEINGCDSSEVWSSFRVARRARVHGIDLQEGPAGMSIVAAHTGYERLPGKPWHRRRWSLQPGRLVIEDEVSEHGVRKAVARFHFHPDVVVESPSVIRLPDGRECRCSVDGGQAEVVASMWAPEFGLRLPSACISITLMARRSTWILTW